ncbi:DMT family transporter [Vibrio nitrifigilis]|uniref:EamA family transporter n=1 Tax=Vibrio nitrifigilis TaxID=2789781 RepID=A0ABS0GLM8_9VIBR|nr:DMT family transporter [Vibrio nitrifigilis]MBF9003237.1 EamA family transporter [Vibrio nitrifigilis]
MNILLAMIPAFFWGTTYAVTQYTLPDWPPLLLGLLRALPAGILLWIVKPSLPSKDYIPRLLLLGTINIGAFFCLIFVMAHTLPATISGVGMMSVPVIAMLIQWVMYKQHPTASKLLCGLLLIACAWQLFSPSSLALSHTGLIAMVTAIACMISGSLLTKKLGTSLDWWSVLSWQLILGGTVLIPIIFWQALHQPQSYLSAIHNMSSMNMLGLLWICILNTAFAYGLYVWLLQRMSVVDFTFGGIANPIAGILCGYGLMHEVYAPYQYLLMGAMIILSLLPQWLELRKQKHSNLPHHAATSH